MKIPGPDHPITIEPADERVRIITLDGRTVANSARALVLREADYPPVHYLPRADTDMNRLTPTTHSTHCPYKGDAAYFSIESGGEIVENAVWTYEAPFPAVEAIKGHLAFYRDKVNIEIGTAG